MINILKKCPEHEASVYNLGKIGMTINEINELDRMFKEYGEDETIRRLNKKIDLLTAESHSSKSTIKEMERKNIYNEIYTRRHTIDEEWSELTPQERIFAYYMFRACLSCGRVYRDQVHGDTDKLIHYLTSAWKTEANQDIKKEIETYLVYLFGCNGMYFFREHPNKKRVLELKHCTAESVANIFPDTETLLLKTLLNPDFESVLTTPGSINESAVHIYERGFTDEDYEQIPSIKKQKINAHYYKKDGNPEVEFYGANGRCSTELKVAIFWLTRALNIAQKHPDNFDEYTVNSLINLIKFFETGDEEFFKLHSIDWLKINSRVQYTMGFLECYDDPKEIVSMMAGEVTFRKVNMEKINPVLLDIEKRLPVPQKYKKLEGGTTIMNASINTILFSSGANGPSEYLAAYCLPNYENIRSEHGSKQIIYPSSQSIGEKLNPELSGKLLTKYRRDFKERYDPHNRFSLDMWDLHVLLHETIGHGSGKLDKHVFKEGDNLMIANVKYNVGDIIDVTTENLPELIPIDASSLEELRADINALYISINEMDLLNEHGMFKDWMSVLGRNLLKDECIIQMTNDAFRRLLSQKEDMDKIVGAHARCNVVITNYLLAGGGIEIIDERVCIDNKDYHVLETRVVDFDLAFKSATELLQKVQEIKSTGDGQECQNLFNKYTNWPLDIETMRRYRGYLDTNRIALAGNIKGSVKIYPEFRPVYNKNNEIVDVELSKEEKSFIEQNIGYRNIELSKDY